jgi:hypothetical protein
VSKVAMKLVPDPLQPIKSDSHFYAKWFSLA